MRAIAIKYFELSKYDSLNFSKNDICKYIYDMIKDIEVSDEKIILPESLDINLCSKVPNRGGYTLRYLKDLAKYFNIESSINKIDLCKEINKKLLKYKPESNDSGKKSKKKIIKLSTRKSKKKSSKKISSKKSTIKIPTIKSDLNQINNLNNLNNLNNS